jgi:hypothetical protein
MKGGWLGAVLALLSFCLSVEEWKGQKKGQGATRDGEAKRIHTHTQIKS